MIKSVGLVNIQSHKETYIEFDNGFNVICGDSDSGKSAILRAISWVTKNKPNGDILKRNIFSESSKKKKETMAVELIVSDQLTEEDISILKERKGKTSSYTVSNFPEPFDVVGRDVPQEVLDIINFSELNFKGQHDPYLLNMSGGALARLINDLVGLSVIDTSISYETKKINSLKSEVETLSRDLSEKNEEIEKLNYLEDLKKDIEQLESLNSKFKKIFLRKENLSSLILQTKKIKEEHNYYLEVLEANSNVSKIVSDLELLNKIKEQKKRLQFSVSKIKETKEELETEKEWLKAYEPCNSITVKLNQISELKNKKNKIKTLVDKIKKIRQDMVVAYEKKIEAKKKFEDFLTKTKTCPICLKSLDQKTIKEMIGK